MKKCLSILLMLTLLLSLAVPAAAVPEFTDSVENVFTFVAEDPGFSISLPDDFLLVTRNSDKDADFYKKFSSEKPDEFVKWMKQENLYLFAADPQGDANINVVITDSADQDFYDYSDEELLEKAAELKKVYESNGYTVADCGIIFGIQNSYIYIESSNKSKNEYSYEFVTIMDKHCYGVAFVSSTAALTKEQKLMAENAANTFAVSKYPTYYANYPAHLFATAPAGCSAAPQLAAATEKDCAFFLPEGSSNFVSILVLQDGKYPKDVKGVTKQDVKDLFGVSLSQLDEKTLNGQKFFICTSTSVEKIDDEKIKYDVTEWLTFRDGYLYLFTIMEAEGEKGKNDAVVKEFLENVELDWE